MALIFIVLAVFSGVFGFAGFQSAMIDGFGKAFFGTFVILFFITIFFGHER
jgi:uncharacterized membrane protein YtjA (UPF0391 family)